MLIVTRKVGEGDRLVIGDAIVVRVAEVRRGGLVVLEVEAPPEVRVDREEVRQRREEKPNDAT